MKRWFQAMWRRFVAWYAFVRYGAYFSEKTEQPILDTAIAPPRTIEMVQRGTVWAKAADGWREVCDTCGGNCGQCGMTERLGNPGFSLDRIIKKTGMNNPVAGLPRP